MADVALMHFWPTKWILYLCGHLTLLGREKVWRLMRLHHHFLYVNEGGVHSHVITIPNFRLADLSLPLYLKTLIPLILTQHYMTLIRNNFF